MDCCRASSGSDRKAQMNVDLKRCLHQLPKMDRTALRNLWQESFGSLPHPRLRREILIRILAYRMQEKALGGLKPSTARRLRAIAEQVLGGKKPCGVPTLRAKAGTRIVREWHGKLHEVAVLENGFEYNGDVYRSLSEIARLITGTRWSGPAFFGLKKRDARRAA
jgi:hypothetical protein